MPVRQSGRGKESRLISQKPVAQCDGRYKLDWGVLQKRIRERDLLVIRGEKITDILENDFLLRSGDKIMLNKELLKNFNLNKENSVKMPLFDPVF